MNVGDHNSGNAPHAHGLRDRKKARRRENILTQARGLFARKGIEATTMAEIAEAVGVSPPTIFNYFGSKDGLLIALITEGSSRSRETRSRSMVRTDGDFPTIVLEFLAEVSKSTLAIADKRVWRYAEAAAIRHPRSELAQKYAENDAALIRTIRDFLDCYDIRLRSGGPVDSWYLARLFFDVWTSDFFDLIKYEDRDLSAHVDRLERSLIPLANLLFQDDFLECPKLKQE